MDRGRGGGARARAARARRRTRPRDRSGGGQRQAADARRRPGEHGARAPGRPPALRITAQCARGQTAPSADERTRLRMPARRRTARGSRSTVRLPVRQLADAAHGADRRAFALFAAAVARAMPRLRNVIVGNEPNLNRFWMPQFGPDGEQRRRARLRAPARRDLRRAEGGSPLDRRHRRHALPARRRPARTGRDTHSPTAFIPDMGNAYRTSGRTRPLMDVFAFHPYPENSSTPRRRRTHPRHDHRRARRLRHARLLARPRVRRDGAAGIVATDRLHGVRDRDASSRRPPGTRTPGDGAADDAARRASPPRRARTGRRSRSRSASRPCARCSRSTPSTSAT